MMSMTSAELNYIVFRYLHESGFTHSAYALGFEAGINNLQIDGNLIPPGALVTFVQKGLRFFEIEADLANCSDTDMDEDLSSLQPLDFITKDANQLQKIVKEKKEKKNAANNESKQEIEREKASKVVEERKEKDKEQEQEEDRNDKHREQEIGKDNDKSNQDQVEMEKLEPEKNGTSGGMEPMETSPSLTSLPIEIPSSEVTVLEGHTSEVFACAWNPSASLLASGSGDSTARIWTIVDGSCRSIMQNEPANVAVLKHYKGRANDKSRDVTTLDWNDDGTLLATGSYDGQARIWSRDGELRNTLSRHKGPIFSLKWNKEGDYLLSGSVDKTAIVWEIKSGEWKQQFEFHSAPTLDVDWRDNVSFATCSTDGTIHVCKVGENQPIKTFTGHQGEVNAIKWDPTGSLLASCSDDQTAKIWSMTQDTYLHDLREHVKEIYTIRWSPTGPGTNNPNQQLVLASASFDSSVKLWDVELGRVIYSLYGHRDPVYSVAFSPNGEYLASGSMDKCMHIWSVKEGKILRTYTGNGGIFEVCWNKEGDKIAACFANNNVCVVDFRM